MPKVHIDNTNLPIHLEEMLKLLIDEEQQRNQTILSNEFVTKSTPTKHAEQSILNGPSTKECFDFILTNRPLDLLTDICLTDSPPGTSVCILNWMRRFLSCLEQPRLDHKSIFQPVQVYHHNLNNIYKSIAQHCCNEIIDNMFSEINFVLQQYSWLCITIRRRRNCFSINSCGRYSQRTTFIAFIFTNP